MKKVLFIQPSLRDPSESYLEVIVNALESSENPSETECITEVIRLRDITLEFCDGRSITQYNEEIQEVYKKMIEADLIVLGFPIYHFSISGVLKNFLDITGDALFQKEVKVVSSALLPGTEIAVSHFYESFSKKYQIKYPEVTTHLSFLNEEIEDKKLSQSQKEELYSFIYF